MSKSRKTKKIILWSGLLCLSTLLVGFLFLEEMIDRKVNSEALEIGIIDPQFKIRSLAEVDFIFEGNWLWESIEIAFNLGKSGENGSFWRDLFASRNKWVRKNLEANSTIGSLKVEEITTNVTWPDLRSKLFADANASGINIESIVIDQFSLRVDGAELEKFRQARPRPKETNNTHEWGFLAELEDPRVDYLRIRDGSFELDGYDQSFGVDYNLTSHIVPAFANFDLEKRYSLGNHSIEVNSSVSLALEDKEVFVTSETKLGELKGVASLFTQVSDPLNSIPSNLKIIDGEVMVRQNATLDLNHSQALSSFFESVFIEVNASDLMIEFGDQVLEISRMITFVDGISPDSSYLPREINAYANFNWNDAANGLGAHLHLRQLEQNSSADPSFALRGGIWEINGSLSGVPYRIRNLSTSLMELNDLSGLPEIFRMARSVEFDEARLFEGENELVIENGRIKVSQGDSLKSLKIDAPGMMISMPEKQLILMDFRYSGEVDFATLPMISKPQQISVGTIQVGDDLEISDVEVTFVVGEDRQVKIEKLSCALDEAKISMNPANLTLRVMDHSSEESAYQACFEGTDLMVEKELDFHNEYFALDQTPKSKTAVFDLTGNIDIESVQPFNTFSNQFLKFDKVVCRDLELADGNLSFEIRNGMHLVIDKLSAHGFNGRVGLTESLLSLDAEDSSLNLTFDEVDGQEIIQVLTGIPMEIIGKFRGEIPLAYSRNARNYKGGLHWNYTGGALEYVDSGSGYLMMEYLDEIFKDDGESLPSALGMLTTSVLSMVSDRNDEVAIQLAGKALKKLELDSMGLDLIPEEDSIRIRVKGKSGLKEGTVFLNYNLTVMTNTSLIILRFMQKYGFIN